MKSIIFTCLAAGSAATSNLFFRQYSPHAKENNVDGYLLCFYFFSFLSSFIFFPHIFTSSFSPIVALIGGCVGLLNVLLMQLTSKALSKGPSGLTFAFQNASSIFPGILLFLFFGLDFGFSYSFFQFGGTVMVLLGLFLGTNSFSKTSIAPSSKWLKYALACFMVQVLALTLIQGRCLLFDCEESETFISHFAITEADDVWFMPSQFGLASFLQLCLFFRKRRPLQKTAITYGCSTGIANFSSTCFLLLATKLALPFEKGILFPCFSVATIILCNLWANMIYKEKFNVPSNVLCALGIFMGVLV